MYNANKEKRKTSQNGGNRTANQKKIRTLGKKESYKYLVLLEADRMKHMEMKVKIKKNTSGERENY